MKLVKIQFATDLLEAILSAKNNEFVYTDCPDDVQVVKVIQDEEDQSNHRMTLVLTSVEADWPETGKLEIVPFDEIPMIDPFQYTVIDPDEDKPPRNED
jgi:hypothetical protein